MKNLKGKTAAVTGAGSGMGRETALLLAKEGCNLAIADINETAVEETAVCAEKEGVKVTRHVVDVSDKKAVYKFADDTSASHGSIHIIMNNAGVSLTAGIGSMNLADFEWIMNINFWGVVYGTQAFLPYIRKSGEGCIVNVSSVFGLMGVPTQSAYCASKFAVRGFTESLQQELELAGGRIKAVSVHPGAVNTNIVLNSRFEQVDGFVQDKNKAAAKFEKIVKTTADEAASFILEAIKKDTRRLIIGSDARMIDRFQRLFPSRYQDIMLNKNKKFKALKKQRKKEQKSG